MPKKKRLDNLVEIHDLKSEFKDENRMGRGPYRAVPRTIEDWNVGHTFSYMAALIET